MRDCQASRLAMGKIAQHAACAAAVPVKAAALAPEEGWRAKGLPIDHIRHMAQHGCVQQSMHRGMVVKTSVVQHFLSNQFLLKF